MADKRISQLVERTDIANNDVLPIVASGATTTNKVTISTIQDWMQDNLDVGVTSVGLTLGTTGTDVNVTGSPITTSGNITINIPTASATNRGLLSSADWTTFNNKQASGNYVTIDTNQSITGIKTFTNSILLKNSPSLAGFILQSFSPNALEFGATISGTTYYSSITFPAGSQNWNLPNASGTLALTSDIPSLAGYVTLGTAQTITAQKTFTTSGSSDTMIISHGSGSGIALDVIKAGNGEAIRIQKTSGSGNAVTITGGLLSAEAATLTGALNGTSASFSNIVTNTSGGFRTSVQQGYVLRNDANNASLGGLTRRSFWEGGTAADTQIFAETGFGIFLNVNGSVTSGLSLASTGAATFSSSVITGGQLSVGSGTLSSDRMMQISGSTFTSGSTQFAQVVNPTFGNSITNLYGIYVSLTNGTSINNRYSLYIDNNNGSASNDFSIYSANSNKSYFAGNVGIGTTSPSSRLHVKGSGTDGLTLERSAPSQDVFIKFQNENGVDVWQQLVTGTAQDFSLTRLGGSGNILLGSTGGNVGIGTASPNVLGFSKALTISSSNSGIELTSADNIVQGSFSGSTNGLAISGVGENGIRFLSSSSGSATERMRITSVGDTQPGADNAYSLGVSGTRWSAVWAANGTIQTSDEREKKDIIESDLGLGFITKLRPVSFKWKVGQNVVTSEVVKDEEGNPILDEEGNEKTESVIIPREGKRTHYGLIAQEVEEVLDGKDFGGFIHDEETDTKGLRYDQFVPLLIKSIQELNDKIAILESKLK
jgi:hypothetical protein